MLFLWRLHCGTFEQRLYLNINLFLKVTFFHMSVHGHTRYKSCGTCHLLSFPLVRTHVGEQLFLFSTRCFLLLSAILGEKRFSVEYKIDPTRLSLVFVCVMYIMASFLTVGSTNVAGLRSLRLLVSTLSSSWQRWLCELEVSNKKQQNGGAGG